MSKSLGLCGVGHPLVDYIYSVSESQVSLLDMKRGSSQLMEEETQRKIDTLCSELTPEKVGGGSLANSLFAFGQLGGKATLFGSLGNDNDGSYYREECLLYGIDCPVDSHPTLPTGRATAFITPDGERTQRASLGSAVSISKRDFDLSSLEHASWIALEGYLVENGESGQELVSQCLEVSVKTSTRSLLTLSDTWLLNLHRDFFLAKIPSTSLVIGNEGEFAALHGSCDLASLVKIYTSSGKNIAMTRGDQGALVVWNGEVIEVSTPKVQVKDLLGAGDMFAGSFLYGLEKGVGVPEATRKACVMASKVIQVVGSRLSGNLQELWDDA